jgi:hypothetical protein
MELGLVSIDDSLSFDDEKDTRPLDWQLPSDCYGGGLAVPSTCGPIDLRTRSNSGNRT